MKLSDVSSSSAGVCCWRTQVRLLSWSWRKLLLVLAELKLLIWAACRGRTSASNGGEMEQKRASWREAVFFQSDSVAVKFRAWIFNQDGFPVRDFFSFLFFGLLSLHNKHYAALCTIFTISRCGVFNDVSAGSPSRTLHTLWLFTGALSACAALWLPLTFCFPLWPLNISH